MYVKQTQIMSAAVWLRSALFVFQPDQHMMKKKIIKTGTPSVHVDQKKTQQDKG